MMLQALVGYADREGLGDLDFEKRPVDYELRIDDQGGFIGLVPLGADKKRAELSKLPMGPSSKNNPGYPSFVVDNAQYALGMAKPGAKAGNTEKCFASYGALVSEAAAASGDSALAALKLFVEQPDEVARASEELARLELKPEKRAGSVLVPALDSDGARRVHEREAVRDWWVARREEERSAAAEGPVTRCLVTGRLAAAVRTHPPLKGPPFPGTGAKLIAYDKAPFSSQFLEQGDNAPVSESAARKYAAALNALLEKDADGRRRSATDLDGDSLVVFWTRDESDAPDLVRDVFAPPRRGAEAVHAAQSVWRGASPQSFDPTRFYAVTLGVNSARVIIRDWFETTAGEIKGNLGRWFDDLALGHGEAVPLPLPTLLHALQATPTARGDKRGLPPGLAARIFRAAVQGGPLPRALLVAAVQRMRVPPQPKENPALVLRARVGLIKAVLRRRQSPLEVPMALDESSTERAYLLGRLFAALEKLQAVASGRGNDLNATIRDRYYGAASSTPAAVFGRLLALSMHHASKAKNNGLGVLAERAKASIMGKLPAERLPRTLGLDDQGLFAVGYYHQREAFYQGRKSPGEPPDA